MKQLFKFLLTVIFFLLSSGATHAMEKTSHSSATLAPTEVISRTVFDIRIKALENIFNKYNSPLAEQAVYYVRYAEQFGVDWKLLPSISGLESSFGLRLMPGSHNAYGWGGGHIYFDSWEEGIMVINKALSERYMARGATDVWSIGPIYAESPTWAVRVNRFMQQIEEEHRRLSTFSLAFNN